MVRYLLGAFLLLVNLTSYFVMLNTGQLVGDVVGFPVQDFFMLTVSLLTVLISYYFFLFPLFNLFLKFNFKTLRTKHPEKVEHRLGLLIFIFQIIFIAFNLFYGVNIAGSGNERASTSFSIFWVFFPIDMLFIIYYGCYRDSKYFKINGIVALVSFITRGQAGILLLFAFMELSKAYREKKISLNKIFVFFIIILVSYPFINILKFAFRLYFGGTDNAGLDSYVVELFTSSQSEGYFQSFIIGIEHLLYRFQIVSIVTEIYRLSDTLMPLYEQNVFFPFWLEGLHGLMLDKIFDEPRRYPLGTIFTSVGNFNWNFEVCTWNVNPGLAGWLLINHLWAAFVFIYTLFLCFISVFLFRLLGGGSSLKDILWFTWAFYLLPGWLGVFVLFIYSLALFIFLKFLVTLLPRLVLK